jgi:23S rRNA (uracil1939-C5)-methyltransferase
MPEPIDTTLSTLSYGPEAIGRHEGQAIFVPFSIPGETVRVQIVEQRKSYARARLLEVLSASPDRAAPRCPHFGVCGGCHWQHLSYPAQLKWKQAVVADQLKRIGGFENPPVRETSPSPAPFDYRNQVQFALTPEGKLGFYALHSDQVLPIRVCHIIQPELLGLFASLDVERPPGLTRVSLRAGADDDLMVILELEGDEAPAIELDLPASVAALWPDGRALTLAGDDHLVERVKGRMFRVSPGSFFQVNTAAAETLVDLVIERLGLRGGESVLDLYCGVGLFAAFIAPRAGRVAGVESYSPAVRDAEINLDEFDNVELYEAPAEEALSHLNGRFDAAVLDPPRAGCERAVLEALAALAPARIVYASCDPATLARDGKRLAAAGYQLEDVQPLDMFPQTYHIETVSLWQRTSY